MDGNGIQPVMPVNGGFGYNDGFGCGGGMWFMWLVVIFALMGGGFGWGNRGNGLTQAEMQAGFNHQDEMGQIRGITYGIADSTFALNNSILNSRAELGKTIMQGDYANAMAITQGNNNLEKTVMQTGWGINQQLNNNRFEQQQCCCEQKQLALQGMTNVDKNACELKTAIHAEGEATRALINANTMQNLRDQLADRDRELQTARFNLGQFAQTASLVHQLRPYPQPAYITNSPYQAMNGYVGCCGVPV